MAVADPNSPCLQNSCRTERNVEDDAISTLLSFKEAISTLLTSSNKIEAHDKNVGDADLIMKIMMVSSSIASRESAKRLWDGRPVCHEFNILMSRIISRDVVKSGQLFFDDKDIKVFKQMVTACHEVLEDILNNPATVTGTSADGKLIYKFNLSIGMVDLLRTACFVQSHETFVNEFSKHCRSTHAQMHSNTCKILRKEEVEQFRHSYAMGDHMQENLKCGLNALKDISLKRDDEVRCMLQRGWANVSTSITSVLLPMILDGRRMKAFNAIASRFYDITPIKKGTVVYGSERLLSEIFDSNSSITSVSRVVKTILSIMAMARLHIVSVHLEKGVRAGRTKSECHNDARESDAWIEVSYLIMALSALVNKHLYSNPEEQRKKAKVNEDGKGVDTKDPDSKSKKTASVEDTKGAPTTNCKLYEIIADWFESAVRDAKVFTVLSSAFAYQGFTPSKIDGELEKVWYKVYPDQGSRGLSLWDVASFLVTARLNLHKNELAGSNVLMCALVCLSGSVGDLMSEKAGGPFVFVDRVKNAVDKMYRACFGESRLKDVKITGRRKVKPNLTQGKTCRATDITRAILQYGIRTQHDKSILMQARLASSFFMLSITEEIRKDLFDGNAYIKQCKSHNTPLVQDGRKDARRIYVIGLQSAPCVNYTMFRAGAASHLIEKNRSNPNSVTTTTDNTEKPFRDIVGGAVINTLLYPLAGIAFEITVLEMVAHGAKNGLKNPKNESDKSWFESRTNLCVNRFIVNLRQRASRIFDVRKFDTDDSNIVCVGTEDAKIMMLQQLSFVNKFCDVIEDNGSLWEDLQLSFSVQLPSDKEVQELDSEDDVDSSDVEKNDVDCPTPVELGKRKAIHMSGNGWFPTFE